MSLIYNLKHSQVYMEPLHNQEVSPPKVKPKQDNLLNNEQSSGQSDFKYPEGRDHVLYSTFCPSPSMVPCIQ